MRQFILQRDEDESGISGTGHVAEGVMFDDGKVVLHWLTEFSSIAIYDNLRVMEAIHSHDGKTEVLWMT